MSGISEGLAVYALIKFVGYLFAAFVLERLLQGGETASFIGSRPWTLALVRLLYGGAGGVGLLMLTPLIGMFYVPALLILRVFAWKLALQHAWDLRSPSNKMLAALTAWSFLLDAPGLFGFLSVGGLNGLKFC